MFLKVTPETIRNVNTHKTKVLAFAVFMAFIFLFYLSRFPGLANFVSGAIATMPFFILTLFLIYYFRDARRYHSELNYLTQVYLQNALKILSFVLLLFILFSPAAWKPLLSFAVNFVRSFFNLDSFFLLISYLAVAVIAGMSILFCIRLYQISQGTYTQPAGEILKKYLYNTFFLMFFLLATSVVAYPGAYAPITDTVSNIAYSFFGATANSSNPENLSLFARLKKAVGQTTDNLTGEISKSNDQLVGSITATKNNLTDSINQTAQNLQNDIDKKLSENGGSISGPLTLSGNDADLIVEGTTTTRDIVPDNTLTYNLGASGKSWNSLYVHRLIGSSPVFIGEGSSAQGLANDGDLVITGDAEVKGTLYAASLNSDMLSTKALIINDAYDFPTADGTIGQVLRTDGSGNLSWGEAGVTPGGLTGQIQFNDNGTLGADADLFWDSSNKRLGIGTSSPNYTLTVDGDLNLTSGSRIRINGTQIALNNLKDATTTSPSMNQVLSWNGSRWVNTTLANISTTGNSITFYPENHTSDTSGYLELLGAPGEGAEADKTVIVSDNFDDPALIEKYISAPGGIGKDSIDGGEWEFDSFTYASDITGDTEIEIRVYKRTTGGSETKLFEVSTGAITSIDEATETPVSSVQSSFDINPTDRLVVKYYAKTDLLTDTTVHLTHNGTTHYSHFHTPMITGHNELAGLQGGTTEEYYHLTSAEYAGTGSGIFARQTAPTFTASATAPRFVSTVATGTAPLTIASTTAVANLNADYLDGQHGAYYSPAVGISTIATVGTVTSGIWNGTAIASGYLGSNVMLEGENISLLTNNAGYISDGNTNWDNSYGLITDGNSGWDNSYGYITAVTGDTLTNKTISAASNTLTGIALTGAANVFGAYNQSFDTNTLFVDAANHRLGIGTTSPGALLDVSGKTKTATFQMTTGGAAGYYLTSDASGNATWADIGSSGGPWTLSTNDLYPDSTAYNLALGATSAGTAKLYVNGNVGIGTTSPGTKLDVSGGSIRTDNQLISTVAIGIAPLAVTSTTAVMNLNADLLDGQHGSYYLAVNGAITGATKTKITYDAKGLVTAGADATTADIADSSNKRYVTDAYITVLGNTSGANSGDNAVNSLYSGLASSKQDTLISNSNIKTVNGVTLLGSGDITQTTITGNAGTVTNGVYTNAANSFTNIAPMTTLAESWIGPSSTAGIYFKGGNVGIGTITPGSMLSLYGTSAAIKLSYDGTYASTLAVNSAGNLTITPASAPTEAAAIIGNATATQDVSVKLTGQYQNFYAGLDNSDSDKFEIGLGATVGTTPYFTILPTSGYVGIGATAPGYLLTVNGQPGANGYTAFTNYSDSRLKENITALGDGYMDKIMRLKPSNFNYNSLTGYDEATRQRRITGFIAQQLQTVFPEMVGHVRINGTDYLDTNLSALPLYLVKGMQELASSASEQQNNIAGLTLKTDENITTLNDLKISTDKNLAIISQNINDLVSGDKNLKDQIDKLNTAQSLSKSDFDNHENRIKATEDLMATLQAQIDELKKLNNQELNVAQIDLNTNDISYIKTLLGVDRVKNPEDIDVLGQLSAVGVETGTLTIKIIDKDSATIGSAIIPAGETSVTVKTKAVTKNSKIYLTPAGTTKNQVLYVGDISEGENLEIKVDSPVTEDIGFNWWIVEAK
ncbi:MAG: tail fiber domain-containing protein [Parcubacteria group bacterium]